MSSNTSIVANAKKALLCNSFLTLFPDCAYDWKNSQGIFNAINRCMVKRSVCFSKSPVSLDSSVFPKEFIDHFSDVGDCVWGLCGVESTRTNKARESLFILCNKVNKHFVATAILTFSSNPQSKTGFIPSGYNISDEDLDNLLMDMKKEKEEHSEEKWQIRSLKRKRDEKSSVESRSAKKHCSGPLPQVSSCSSNDTSSEVNDVASSIDKSSEVDDVAFSENGDTVNAYSECDDMPVPCSECGDMPIPCSECGDMPSDISSPEVEVQNISFVEERITPALFSHDHSFETNFSDPSSVSYDQEETKEIDSFVGESDPVSFDCLTKTPIFF